MECSGGPALGVDHQAEGEILNKKTGCLALVLTLALGAVVWVRYPGPRYSKESQAILEAVQTRDKQEQALAKTPEADGYLHPTFLPYWGRKGLEERPNNRVEPVVKAFSRYCDLKQGTDVLLKESVDRRDPALARSALDYSKLYDDFREVLKKPHFVVPQDRPRQYDTIIPNYLSYRALSQTNSGYAYYLSLEEQPDRALQVIGDTMRFSKIADGPADGLISRMISLAGQSNAQAAAVLVLNSSKVLPSESALKELIATMEATQCPDSELVRAAENEYAVMAGCVTAVREGKLPPGELVATGVGAKVPGFLSRELILLENDYLEALLLLESGKEPDLSWMDNSGAVDWLLARHGYASTLLIPNFGKSLQQQRLGQKRQAFVHLYSWLMLDRVRAGHWPTSLKELESHGFQPLPGLEPDKLEYQVQGETMSLVWDHPDDEVLISQEPPEENMAKWKVLDQRTWRVQHSL